jgi:hypothetical protein
MEKSIIDLAAAIGKVDSDYIKVIGYDFNSKEYLQAAEHAFSAELYHQFRSIIDCDKTNYYKGVKLQFDLEKQRFGGKRPDMVLHASPLNRNIQKLYIEVKTNLKKKAFKKDINKLYLSTAENDDKEQLGYFNAAFVVGKIDLKEVENQIKSFIKDKNLDNDERSNRIFLLHFLKNENVTVKKFSDIK